MAISGAIIASAAVTAYSGYQASKDARAARQQAEAQAAQEREALAALQSEPTPVIPIADEEAKKGRRRSITEQMRRRGRASTILTSNASSDALGG